ncbi:hypothetical protein [Brevundimonas sp.]
MTPEEADDWIAEHGVGSSPTQVWNDAHDNRDDEDERDHTGEDG